MPLADQALALGRLVSGDRALRQALEALPALVPSRVLRGEIANKIGDFADALLHFDEVIARVPEHREAWLGRTIALSNLERHDEAIASADRMILLGEWYLGEAFYWKAWNLFQQSDLVGARAARTEAQRLLFNADVHYLGALIAYREEKWEEARAELADTLRADATHCDAHFTLGAIHTIEKTWASADPVFAQAGECFAQRAVVLETSLAEVDSADLSEAQKAGLRQRRQRSLEAAIGQKHWAGYNRAVALANMGQRDTARALADEVSLAGGRPGSAAADLRRQLDQP